MNTKCPCNICGIDMQDKSQMDGIDEKRLEEQGWNRAKEGNTPFATGWEQKSPKSLGAAFGASAM